MNNTLLDEHQTPKYTEDVLQENKLYCIGFLWLRKKKLGLVFGVKKDAKMMVEHITKSLKHSSYA